MKNLLLLFLMLGSAIRVSAQETKTDSVAFKTKIATEDAKHFKLDK